MNNTNLIRRTLLCLSIIAASNSWAASSSYQSEVGLNYIDRDNSETYFVSGEYFFAPVLLRHTSWRKQIFLVDRPVSVVL